FALAYAGTVERAAYGVIAHAREVFDAAAADQHHRVLLKVVPFTADVAGDFIAVRQANAANLAQRRVGLFGSGGIHARAHTALLRRCPESGYFRFLGGDTARLPNELTCCGHAISKALFLKRRACKTTGPPT